jgi:hypothetical protein
MNSLKIASALALLAVLTACGSGKSSAGATGQPAGGAPLGVATPDCHGETPVWALQRVKVFLLPDDPHFGRTKHGEFMCLSDAESQGYRHARGPLHHNRQHHRLFSQ